MGKQVIKLAWALAFVGGSIFILSRIPKVNEVIFGG